MTSKNKKRSLAIAKFATLMWFDFGYLGDVAVNIMKPVVAVRILAEAKSAQPQSGNQKSQFGILLIMICVFLQFYP